MRDEGPESIIDHPGEDNAGERTTVKNDPFGRPGAVVFHRFKDEFKVEGRIVGNKGKVFAKIRQIGKNRFDSGFSCNHFIGDPVDCRGLRGNGTPGIDERAEGFDRFGPAEAHSSDFNDGIGFRLNSCGLQIERNKVHGVSYTERFEGWHDFIQAIYFIMKKEFPMKITVIPGLALIGILALVGILALTGYNQDVAAAEIPTDLWQTDYDAALKQAGAENKYVLVSISGLQWCGWCQALEKEVFSQPEFISYAKDHLVCVLLDFDRYGQATSEKFARQHEMLLSRYQIQGFPTVLILNPQGKAIARDGYQRGGAKNYVRFITSVIAADSSE
ncbi:MAG: hypothetical protein PWQ29_1599 [Verrucomicrobiota bacterium]|nr:hypothetical protein [Verrucomicrobiota bacterium]